jgi:hypothetical protein
MSNGDYKYMNLYNYIYVHILYNYCIYVCIYIYKCIYAYMHIYIYLYNYITI